MGVVVNQKILSANATAEADVPNFEILFGLLVNAAMAFAGANGPKPRGIAWIKGAVPLPGSAQCSAHPAEYLSLSASRVILVNAPHPAGLSLPRIKDPDIR
jgi:hypothetical protein